MKLSTRVVFAVFAVGCAATVIWLLAGGSGSAPVRDFSLEPAAQTALSQVPVPRRAPAEESRPVLPPPPRVAGAPQHPRPSLADRHIKKVREARAPSDRWKNACEHIRDLPESPHLQEARDHAAEALADLEEESLRKLTDILAFSPAPERSDDVESAVGRLHEHCTNASSKAPLPRMAAACRAFDAWRRGLNEARKYNVVVEKATVRRESSGLVDCDLWCEDPDLFARIEACGDTFTTDIVEDSFTPSWTQQFAIPWRQSCQDIQVSLCYDEPGDPDCDESALKGRYPIASLDATFTFEKGSAQLVVSCPECTPKQFMMSAYEAAGVPVDPCAAGATAPE